MSEGEDRETYIKRMKEAGFDVVFPEPNELFIDIDTEEQYEIFKTQFQVLQNEIGGFEITKEHYSKSGPPRKHIYIRAPMVFQSPVEQIAFQAALGSDPMRETLSLVRFYGGDEYPTLFAEVKSTKKKKKIQEVSPW